MWLDQAKMDYKASLYMMGSSSLTPVVVPPPEQCRAAESSNEHESEETEEDTCFGKNEEQKSPQFPAVVCFLCHEAVEKCIKGVMYAYCGLKSDTLNCSSLVTLFADMKGSSNCPRALLKPIEQCVMQVNEHQNKSRYPNFQIPPCAPASVYTTANAREAILATQKVFDALREDLKIAPLLGDPDESPVPCFTSMLRSLGGNDGKYYARLYFSEAWYRA
jgi:HEPN domain-containing protein